MILQLAFGVYCMGAAKAARKNDDASFIQRGDNPRVQGLARAPSGQRLTVASDQGASPPAGRAANRARTPKNQSTPSLDSQRLFSKEQMRAWKEWKDRQKKMPLWKWWLGLCAWWVWQGASQRQELDAVFRMIFAKLLDQLPLMEAAKVTICKKSPQGTDTAENTFKNLAHRTITLQCARAESLFRLEEFWPQWKRHFGIRSYKEMATDAAATAYAYFARRTSASSTPLASTLAFQKVKIVVTDVQRFPFRGFRDGDGEFVTCSGGHLNDEGQHGNGIPLESFSKRCVGFFSGQEVETLMLSLIQSYQSGNLNSKETVRADIKYWAEWLILSGMGDSDSALDNKDVLLDAIKSANQADTKKIFTGNYHRLREMGKLVASSWLDSLEGQKISLQVHQLVDLGLIPEEKLNQILQPLGTVGTDDEYTWRSMSSAERNRLIRELEEECKVLKATAEKVEDAAKRMTSKESVKNELNNLLSFVIGRKGVAMGAATATTQLVTSGAKAIVSPHQLKTITALDHKQILATSRFLHTAGRSVQATHGAIQDVSSVGGFFGRRFFPGFTANVEHKVAQMNEALEKITANGTVHHDMAHAGGLTVHGAHVHGHFDTHATAQWSGMYDFIRLGSPDGMQAQIHAAGNIGLSEDGVVTGASNGVNTLTQHLVQGMDLAAQHGGKDFINGMHDELARKGTSALANKAAGQMSDQIRQVIMNDPRAGIVFENFLPDTAKRNLFLDLQKHLRHVVQNGLDHLANNHDYIATDNTAAHLLDKINSAIQIVHPHTSLDVKYNVLGQVYVEHGRLVLKELVQYTPIVHVESTVLLHLAELNPVSQALSLLKIAALLHNVHWHVRMRGIVSSWDYMWSNGETPTACICGVPYGETAKSVHYWPHEVVAARHPGKRIKSVIKQAFGGDIEVGDPHYARSYLTAKMISCKYICVALEDDSKIQIKEESKIDRVLAEQKPFQEERVFASRLNQYHDQSIHTAMQRSTREFASMLKRAAKRGS